MNRILFPRVETRGWIAICLTLLLALPAAARPHHRKPHKHAARSAAVVRDLTLSSLPPGADRQKLVLEGRLAPFYDPKDLSKPPVLSAPAAILVDADTGRTLWSMNPDARHYPASTTKILTALIFIEHTRPTDIVTCLDPNITKIEPSSLNIKPWEKFSAQDLVYGTLLRSGNDGAVLMAEYVAGTLPKFADVMNARARQIGATNSHFVTPNGLHDPAHFTTVRDMAKIACAAMRNPRFADAVSQPERTISRTVNVHDSVIIAKAKNFWLTFPGADGIKTGYTHQAGHCFVGSATRDGRRLLSVVFEAKNSAVKDTVPLLSWGFQRFPRQPMTQMSTPSPTIPVAGGSKNAIVKTNEGGGAGSSLTTNITRVGLATGGSLVVLLVAWRWYAATFTKSARRRRRRVEAARRGVDRLG